MALTFRVDDVTPAATAPPTLTLGEHLGAALAIGGDAGLRVLDAPGVHPLLAAVHAAFAEHRPLVLSPDAIWLTIAIAGDPAARSSEACESIPVIGKSVAAILAHVLRSDGATELPVVSTLIDVLPEWARARRAHVGSAS